MKRILALGLLIALLLCGCGRIGSIDELFRLPQLSDEYLDLQRTIDEILGGGAVFAAPTGGTHRQSVQLYDLDGDGVTEALAFFRFPGEKPLKIVVFRQSEGSYGKAAVIEGDGESIESIDYADMDGDGWREIVVGWGVGSGLKMLELFTLRGFLVSSVAATDYSRYVLGDMDGDGDSEVMAVRQDAAEGDWYVRLWALAADGEVDTAYQRLSNGLEGISKLNCGKLRDLSGALFAEGSCQGGLVTDILTWQGGELRNITLDSSTGISEGTLRNSAAAFQDLQGIGQPLIPMPRTLPAQGETAYRVLDWYGYNRRGRPTLVMTTYHNYSDSWYLVLPAGWGDQITIRREDVESGERGVVFSRCSSGDQPVTDFLVIYTLSGENRAEQAAGEGRLTLLKTNQTIYAASICMGRSEWAQIPDASYLRENFHLIYSEWITQQGGATA